MLLARATGDGRSAHSPVTVPNLILAYLMVRDSGLHFERHRIERKEGGILDVIEASDRATGQPRPIFFRTEPKTPEEITATRALRSIMTSGDGRSPRTALAVPGVRTEYAILFMLGLQRSQQVLMPQDGAYYDRLTVIDPADGTVREMYFRLPGAPGLPVRSL
ncbi:Hypothetical protein HVPorG_01323 [Roseomonas mucosa]|uniref:hypothetical protein n=1 Tax=Roseomonas mucosa TaxID=207340 RepID=UPI0022067BC0|nr:hypothetical protein [Roseomonas mucosa]QDJ09660.1 Hypothetical protein HVPorG_01323 [Roseomonas mucosa]